MSRASRESGQHGKQPPVPKAPEAVSLPERKGWGAVRSQDISVLAGVELRNYARSIGVNGRDCNELTEDRLRQNCDLHLSQHFQALSE